LRRPGLTSISGDGGVAGSQSASCSKFVPTFPSGCPYVSKLLSSPAPHTNACIR
jgi:hypothetical protein